MSAGTSELRRPRGQPPRGTFIGLAGLILLGVGVPFLTIQSLVPVLRDGLDIWLASILPVLGIGFAVIVVVASGLRHRGYWSIVVLFWLGVVLLAGLVAGVLTGLAILLRSVPIADPGLAFVSVVNIVMWLLLAPFGWLLLRMLRLRYWQPWTNPADWEDDAPNRGPRIT